MKLGLPTLASRLPRPDPRKRKMLSLKHPLLGLYLDLHNCSFLSSLVKTRPHPLEEFIDSIPRNPQAIADSLGIVVPPGYNVASYLYANIVDYRQLFSELTEGEAELIRQPGTLSPGELLPLLHRTSDTALFHLLGAYVAYQSRSQLISRLSYLMTHQGFFVPLVRKPSNSETYLYESTSDETIFMVGYGTVYDYRCFSLDELLANFHQEDHHFLFHLPGTQKTVPLKELFQLRNLATIFQQDKLADLIILGIQNMQADIPPLEVSSPHRVIDYLFHLFQLGMYMRRWDGEGPPYPLAEKDTLRDYDPIPKTAAGLVTLNESYERLRPEERDFIDSIILFRYRRGELEVSGRSLIECLASIVRGEECIRSASSYLIGTAYYILAKRFRIIIRDFDPAKLNNIA